MHLYGDLTSSRHAFKMNIPDATCSGAKKWGKAHVLNKLSEITKNVTIGGNTT